MNELNDGNPLSEIVISINQAEVLVSMNSVMAIFSKAQQSLLKLQGRIIDKHNLAM